MSRARKSSRRQRKKQAALVIVMAVLLAGGILAAVLLTHNREEKKEFAEDTSLSTSQSQNNRISYHGKDYRYKDYLSNYLFMGIDTRNEVDSYETQADAGQADSIFLVSLDRIKNQLTVLGIPRDTMARIEVFNPSGKSLGMTNDHINIQYGYGDGKHKSCDLMRTAVSRLLGEIPIEGYCSLNMDGIPVLTEVAEGVEIVVPDDSLEAVNPEFVQGAQVTLTGDNVEQFVRYRDIDQELSALVRQDRQKVFLDAYLKKAQEKYAKDPSFITKVYESVKPYMVTGMGNDLFVRLMEASMESETLKAELPGKGEMGTMFDEFHVDEEALQELVVSLFYEEDN